MMDKNRLRNLIETLDKFVDELQYYQNIENQLLELKNEENKLVRKGRDNNLQTDHNKLILDEELIYILDSVSFQGEAIQDATTFFDKKCPYCKQALFTGNPRDKIHIDHFHPIAKGGTSVPWNILPVCQKCNNKKKDRLPEHWLPKDDFKLCNDYLNEVKKKYTNYLQEYLDNYKKMPGLIQEYIDNNWLQNHDDLLSLIYELILLTDSSRKDKQLKIIENLRVTSSNKKDIATNTEDKLLIAEDKLLIDVKELALAQEERKITPREIVRRFGNRKVNEKKINTELVKDIFFKLEDSGFGTIIKKTGGIILKVNQQKIEKDAHYQ